MKYSFMFTRVDPEVVSH